MQESTTRQAESAPSIDGAEGKRGLQTWIKVGTIAAASALAGGLAAAWFYRKTLNTLRDAEVNGGSGEFHIPDSETDGDV